MTEFHTYEYIHFLERVTPETAEQLTRHGNQCEWLPTLQRDCWLIVAPVISPHR